MSTRLPSRAQLRPSSSTAPAVASTVSRARTHVSNHSYRAAYAVAVAGALTSALLTYLFVTDATPAVREGAPFMAALINALGWEAMLATKGVVLVGFYSVALPRVVNSERTVFERVTPTLARRLAWAIALFCAFDAAWDLHATAHLEPPTLTLSPTGFVTTLLVLLVVLVVVAPKGRIVELSPDHSETTPRPHSGATMSTKPDRTADALPELITCYDCRTHYPYVGTDAHPGVCPDCGSRAVSLSGHVEVVEPDADPSDHVDVDLSNVLRLRAQDETDRHIGFHVDLVGTDRTPTLRHVRIADRRILPNDKWWTPTLVPPAVERAIRHETESDLVIPRVDAGRETERGGR